MPGHHEFGIQPEDFEVGCEMPTVVFLHWRNALLNHGFRPDFFALLDLPLPLTLVLELAVPVLPPLSVSSDPFLPVTRIASFIVELSLVVELTVPVFLALSVELAVLELSLVPGLTILMVHLTLSGEICGVLDFHFFLHHVTAISEVAFKGQISPSITKTTLSVWFGRACVFGEGKSPLVS